MSIINMMLDATDVIYSTGYVDRVNFGDHQKHLDYSIPISTGNRIISPEELYTNISDHMFEKTNEINWCKYNPKLINVNTIADQNNFEIPKFLLESYDSSKKDIALKWRDESLACAFETHNKIRELCSSNGLNHLFDDGILCHINEHCSTSILYDVQTLVDMNYRSLPLYPMDIHYITSGKYRIIVFEFDTKSG